MGREFPDGPVVRTWCSHFGGLGSVPGLETKIPQVAHCIQNDTKYCFKKSKGKFSYIYICIKQMRWGAGQGNLTNQKTTILEENICKFTLQKAPFFNI